MPNDGKCHLSKSGMYTKALVQDYPSLGQICRAARHLSINLRFAVTSDVSRSYHHFTEYIRGSSVAPLARDSSNVVTLIKEQYEVEISQ